MEHTIPQDTNTSSHNILFQQNKVLFEMLQILIANMEIKDGSNALGYDFSYAEPLFNE